MSDRAEIVRSIRLRRRTGIAAIAIAVGFNVPYAWLAARFDYPAILRRPAGVVLDSLAAGGPAVVLAWYLFMLSALALVPLSIALAGSGSRLARASGLAVGAAIAGSLAGITQAIGLSRWVFVVPGLARLHADPASTPAARSAAELSFDLLNAWGGVGIGEHLGQLMTALFLVCLALLQHGEGARATAGLGLVTAAAITLGTGEALAFALGADGAAFSLATTAGFLGLTLWLMATGVRLLRA